MKLSTSLESNRQIMHRLLPLEKSYDLVCKEITVNHKDTLLLCVNGFVNTDVQQQVLSNLQRCDDYKGNTQESFLTYVTKKICFAQISSVTDADALCTFVLSGLMALIIDGFDMAILIDVRSYPFRSLQEPDSEKISRGSRDGFIESLVTNVTLLRRRLRDRDLIFSMQQVGKDSHTDVVVAYKDSLVDKELLTQLITDLGKIQADSLTMGTQSLAELLLPKKWWSPLPSFRITERPDVACSYLEEGYILVLTDNSPLALILPCTIFQFTQSPEDYCKPPLSGTYTRWIRFLCIPINLLLLPTFLLLTVYYPGITQALSLLVSSPLPKIRLVIYTFVAEFLLDLFKYSTAQSDSRFSGTLSIIGGFIIGDMAISLNWVSPEILFYAGFTLLTSLSLPSTEFADALRIYRIIILICTSAWGLPGFVGGILLSLISIATTPVYGKYSYLWPLFPFQWSALSSLLFRYPTAKKQPRKNRGRNHHSSKN